MVSRPTVAERSKASVLRSWMRKVVGSNLGRRCFIYIDRFLLLWKSVVELRALETATIRREAERGEIRIIFFITGIGAIYHHLCAFNVVKEILALDGQKRGLPLWGSHIKKKKKKKKRQ